MHFAGYAGVVIGPHGQPGHGQAQSRTLWQAALRPRTRILRRDRAPCSTSIAYNHGVEHLRTRLTLDA